MVKNLQAKFAPIKLQSEVSFEENQKSYKYSCNHWYHPHIYKNEYVSTNYIKQTSLTV